jgi:hypothetical protein
MKRIRLRNRSNNCYQKKINDRFMLDCFRWRKSTRIYHGYYISTGERYETAKNWNKSGEWLPYRGGVMVSYRLNYALFIQFR